MSVRVICGMYTVFCQSNAYVWQPVRTEILQVIVRHRSRDIPLPPIITTAQKRSRRILVLLEAYYTDSILSTYSMFQNNLPSLMKESNFRSRCYRCVLFVSLNVAVATRSICNEDTSCNLVAHRKHITRLWHWLSLMKLLLLMHTCSINACINS